MAEITDHGDGWRFGGFTLDLRARQLRHGDMPVELGSRYFDALTLLVTERGNLVPKDRFMDEVWKGVPVTDEALTQAVRSLRKALGDDAADPCFIATVPKHGYRFVGKVEPLVQNSTPSGTITSHTTTIPLPLRTAAGGTLAGIVVGLGYGSLAGGNGGNALSTLLVLVLIGAFAGLVSGGGVGLGIAGLSRLSSARWTIVLGATLGGFVTGWLGRIIGIDGLGLLFGGAPLAMTGASEGGLIGFVAGLAIALGRNIPSHLAALAGAMLAAITGAVIGLLDGRLLGGSLAELGARFDGARLNLAVIGQAFGEDGFGLVTLVVSGAVEAAVFGACVVFSALWPGAR